MTANIRLLLTPVSLGGMFSRNIRRDFSYQEDGIWYLHTINPSFCLLVARTFPINNPLGGKK
jgi:hypothetical protein